MKIKKNRHAGFTLVEIMLVTIVLSVSALAATQIITPSGLISSLDSQSASTEIATTLRTARHRAIATGQEHRVRWLRINGRLSGYVIESSDGRSFIAITAPRDISNSLALQASSTTCNFLPNGDARFAWTLQINEKNRPRLINVNQAGGTITHAEL